MPSCQPNQSGKAPEVGSFCSPLFSRLCFASNQRVTEGCGNCAQNSRCFFKARRIIISGGVRTRSRIAVPFWSSTTRVRWRNAADLDHDQASPPFSASKREVSPATLGACSIESTNWIIDSDFCAGHFATSAQFLNLSIMVQRTVGFCGLPFGEAVVKNVCRSSRSWRTAARPREVRSASE